MRQTIRRRFPFITTGIVLVLVAVLPTVIAMVRAFRELQNEVQQSGTGTISGGVSVAFHPALIICGLVGVFFIVIGIGRPLARGVPGGGPPVA